MKMLTAHLKGKNPFPSCQHHTVICFLSVEANITTKSHLSFVLLLALGYSAYLSTGAFYQLTQLLRVLDFAKRITRCLSLCFRTVCDGEITGSQVTQAQVQILAEPLTSWTNSSHLLNFPEPEFPSL